MMIFGGNKTLSDCNLSENFIFYYS
jgi:hypothetical protein